MFQQKHDTSFTHEDKNCKINEIELQQILESLILRACPLAFFWQNQKCVMHPLKIAKCKSWCIRLFLVLYMTMPNLSMKQLGN